MHVLHSDTLTRSTDTARSLSGSVLAYVCALGGAAVTSYLVFDHQPPTHPEDVAVYLALLSATVIIGWWFTNVVAWFIALRRGVQLHRFTLPGAKRIAQFMLAATLSTSCVADATSDPVMVLVEQRSDGATETPTTLPSTLPSTTSPPTTGAPTTTAPTTTAPTTSPSPAPMTDSDPATNDPEVAVAVNRQIDDHQVIVSEGDNLWALSAETLIVNGVPSPSNGQIAEYWRLVVAANQVQSGNPNLIAIGEAITMPAFDLGPSTGSQESPTSQPSATSGIAIR